MNCICFRKAIFCLESSAFRLKLSSYLLILMSSVVVAHVSASCLKTKRKCMRICFQKLFREIPAYLDSSCHRCVCYRGFLNRNFYGFRHYHLLDYFRSSDSFPVGQVNCLIVGPKITSKNKEV